MVDRLPEKAGPRNSAHADIAGQHFAEFQVAVKAKLGNIHQDVISALGNRVLQADGIQTFYKQVPLAGISGKQVVIVFLAEAQAGNNGLLQGRSSADRKKSCTFLMRSVISGGAMV